jgi:hypothetical protein
MRYRLPLLMLLATLPSLAGAESRQVQMQVSAYVEPRASIESTTAPATFELTAADLERGYKDVSASYRVRSNDPRGYFLRFDTRVGLTTAVEVTGLAVPVTLGDLGADILQQPAARQQEHALKFRLHLASGATAGTYALPVVVGVATL